jgi:hypothetical protein
VTDSDLAALKKAMADAHPDHGGTAEAFIKARKAYLAAKWLREEAEAETAEAERRQREAAAAAEEERRRREAAEAMARYRGRAAKAICACAAVILVFAVVALHKEHSVTANAGRHGELTATRTAPMTQFAPSKPYEAVSDGPKTPIESASADERRPVATVAVASDSMHKEEMDVKIRSTEAEPSTSEQQLEAPLQTVTPVAPEVTPPASPAPSAPERQAESVVYYLTAVESRGNVDDLSAYYSDTINYYGKPTAKSGVVADKIKFMRRWPNRKFTIRPESLTVACDIMRCAADGMIDFDVSNAGKRSIGTASFTYHMLMRRNNSEPPVFLVIAENSIVVRRAVTNIGQAPVAAPWPADRVQGQ